MFYNLIKITPKRLKLNIIMFVFLLLIPFDLFTLANNSINEISQLRKLSMDDSYLWEENFSSTNLDEYFI